MEAAPIRLNTPGTVEEIFNHYKGRRSGLLRALTYEVEDFYQSCDPDKENLSLYGFSNGTWEVSSPMEEIPPELPEPALGINFARDGMQRKDWLSLVAAHSDAWILAVAFFFGARLNKAERKQLFNLIIDLPTLFDIVTGQMPSTEKGSSANMTSKVKAEPDRTAQPHPPPEEAADNSNDYEEDDDEGDEPNETACGMCGRRYTADEFWICCDICERWFHGKCVKVSPAKAEQLKQYKCPSCSKRART